MEYTIVFVFENSIAKSIEKINELAVDGWQVHTWDVNGYCLLERKPTTVAKPKKEASVTKAVKIMNDISQRYG